jgi:phage shock protein A
MSAIQSQLADMTKEQLIERIQKMERLCQASAVDATEQTEKVAELEASLQSTENYWKSKYEAEVDKVADLQTEVKGFKSICNEYLCGPEASWQDLSNWCEDKTDEIVEIKDEVEDLEEQVSELANDIACLQEALKIVKDENEVNKKNLRQVN